jgi:hypothetical protein
VVRLHPVLIVAARNYSFAFLLIDGRTVKSITDRFVEAIEAAEMMFAEMLGAYVRSAVLCVLLGIGIGFGWHYFVDRTGGSVAASTTASPARQDALTPPSSNQATQRERSVPDVARNVGPSDVEQPARSTGLDLSNEEKLALVTLLMRDIAQDRHQSSAHIRSLKQILVKLDPKPQAQPYSPPKVSAPPDAKRGGVRQRQQSNPSVAAADEIRARQ